MSDVLSSTKGLSTIDKFKVLTAAQFDQWYDWPAQCDRDNNSENAFRAEHDPVTGIYTLHNFCLSPVGPLSGFNPTVGPYFGSDDVETWTMDTTPLRFLRNFLANVSKLSAPPSCFLDRSLLIMPSFLRCDNPGHVFMRMAALMDIAKRGFPNAKIPDDLTTAYLFLEELNSDLPMERHVDLSRWKETAFPDYTTVVAQSHFGVYADGATAQTTPQLFAPLYNSAEGPKRLAEPICFRKGLVYMTATQEESKLAREGRCPRDVVPLFFSRSGRVLNEFNDRMRACGNVPKREGVNRINPRVLFSVRSSTRRISTAPELIAELGDWVQRTLNGTLIVHEMSESSPMELVELYSSVDIVVSLYGAGLFYAMFMPPGAVAVEINWQPKRSSEFQGINHPQNRWTDYGGNLFAVGVHHVVVTFPGFHAPPNAVWMDWVPFQPEIYFSEFHLSGEVIQHALLAAQCLLQNEIAVPEQGKCEQHLALLPHLQQHAFLDVSGSLLAQYCRLQWDAATESRPGRIPWVFHHASGVSASLREVRSRVWSLWNADPPPAPLNRMVLTAECGLNPVVAQEIILWLHYFYMNLNVTILYSPPHVSQTPQEKSSVAEFGCYPKEMDQPLSVEQLVAMVQSPFLQKCVTYKCENVLGADLLRRGQLTFVEVPVWNPTAAAEPLSLPKDAKPVFERPFDFVVGSSRVPVQKMKPFSELVLSPIPHYGKQNLRS
jgi:hypothetical protein